PENMDLTFLDDFISGNNGSSATSDILQNLVLLNGNSIENRWESHSKLYASTGSYSPFTRYDLPEDGGVPTAPSNEPALYGAYGIIKKMRGKGKGRSFGISLIAFGT